MAAATGVIYARPHSSQATSSCSGFTILSCGNRFDEFDRQISEEMRQENEFREAIDATAACF